MCGKTSEKTLAIGSKQYINTTCNTAACKVGYIHTYVRNNTHAKSGT